MTDKKLCGAKTRVGTPCKNSGMKNGRCRKHGGLSTGAPKGNQNGYRHGLYSRIFPEAKLDEAIAMQGDVSRELAITRLQLVKCLELQQLQGDTPEIAELKDEILADEEDEHSVKAARAKDAKRCGEYYDPDDDDSYSGQESEPLKRTRIYRKRDWSVEENRLITMIAKLELQLVKQQISVIELEQRKKELETQSRGRSKDRNVEEMSDDQLDDYLSELLSSRPE